MITTPTSITRQSKYANIVYNFSATPFIPTIGNLNFVMLNYSARISTIITIKEPLVSDFKHATITLSYKQVKAKNARKGNTSHLLLRDDLENDIKIFIETHPELENFSQTQILLLNDLVLDSGVGDTGLQGMVMLEKHDGSHNFFLHPGAAIRDLTEIIGLGIFDCDSIKEVFDAIIFDMYDMVITNIIPPSNIQLTESLKMDILRYLHFFIYYE